MSGPHPLVDRINLGGGVQQSDLPMLAESLGHLFSRLGTWPPGSVDIWLRVKDRDQAGMKTTIEVQVPRTPHAGRQQQARAPRRRPSTAPPTSWCARSTTRREVRRPRPGEHPEVVAGWRFTMGCR